MPDIRSNKRVLGQYFTVGRMWLDPIVNQFTASYDRVVDPFAGGGDLLKPFANSIGYDIDASLGWTINDSLATIPRGAANDICVTNPPYLAKNAAKRRAIACADFGGYEDLYLLALDRCLDAFDRVVAIIPESFLGNAHHKDRLAFVNVIEAGMFADTDCPVLVGAWSKDKSDGFEVYKNSTLVGSWGSIAATVPSPSVTTPMRFNDPTGELGLVAYDSKHSKVIRFCRGDEVGTIKTTTRSKTRIALPMAANDDLIAECNRVLTTLRRASADLVLSPFKGNTQAGERRRRLDFGLARRIVNVAIGNLALPGLRQAA